MPTQERGAALTRGPVPATAHLTLRYAAVHRALRAAAARRAEHSKLLADCELSPYCVTDAQAELLLDLTDPAATRVRVPAHAHALAPVAVSAEEDLRRRAARAEATHPLDALSRAAGLDAFETDALLLCLAPVFAPEHALLFGYLLDDLDQRRPNAELVLTVLAPSLDERLARLPCLGPYGPLRRFGLLVPEGQGGSDGSGNDLLRSLNVPPGLASYLLDGRGDLALLAHDPGELSPPRPPLLGGPALAAATRLGDRLRARRDGVAALWGLPEGSQLDAAWAVAAAAGLTLRRAPDVRSSPAAEDARAEAARALATAGALGSALWLPTDALHEAGAATTQVLADVVARAHVPVVLTGRAPWRPLGLLADGRYAEETVPEPDYPQRRALWAALGGPASASASASAEEDAPEVFGAGGLDALAARFRLTPEQMRATAGLAGAEGVPMANAVTRVLATMPAPLAEQRTPVHDMADLVLPAEQARQVEEIASAFRAWPRVSQEWGFGGGHGGPGLKALFTGEPGTGKTLAAEVIAGSLGVDLLRVDLARTVSKWVGETEKNLDKAFRQAEAAHALLLFDEADSLFGKRGTVDRGSDRYANLEVGFLLQRLERSPALVVLTTNLHGNLDSAFTRRFQFVVRFSRPGDRERYRLWRLAFPARAPLAPDLRLDGLARLDLTGAAIMAAARTAALLAARSGSTAIGREHLVEAIARQFRQESRLPRAGELELALGQADDAASAGSTR
ncbi:ATP-binding protein [Streptomyces chartreusis]|uniref:ATP-binding protein n=1 Tax=Streptomyces chartreusis TaxID=1969 RepID=UPI0036F69319